VNYGTLSQITLPTGGSISYAYVEGGSTLNCQNAPGRWVATRTVNANDGTGPHTWTYTYGTGSTVVTDPLGNDVVHTLTSFSQYQCAMYETGTQYYQGSHTSGTLLKTVNTAYSYTSSPNTTPYGATNVVPISIATVWPNSQTSKITKSYDSGFSYVAYQGGTGYTGIYGKEISESEYDYPSGTSLLRTTNTGYAWQSPNPNYSNYLTNNLIDSVSSVQVLDSGGTQRAYTTYGYDESSLQSSGITEQKVAGESYPGNQTSIHRWLNGSTTGTTNCAGVTSGYLVTTKAYYDTGEVPTVTDPCGYQTNYQYSGTYYGAFVTKVTNALGQSMSYDYDSNTGAVTSIQDANSQTTTKNYDILTRPISISYPDGGSTTACYTDMGGGTCTQSGAPYQVVVTKAITSSPVLNETSTIVFDGLGRVSQTQLTSDSPSTTSTLTTYDALGRKSQVYNPTRCSPITTNCGETTWGYTTTNYDPLSRVTSVVEQDSSTLSTSYSAFPCTTVTDEAGKARTSCVDGLGRMTGVWEDPSGLNYETDYTYDALGNLTYVNQKGNNVANARTRTFQYDSLSQLTNAVNPESGQIAYAYDADGNVITKTAPLPNQTSTLTVTTSKTYDKLNRLTGKGYKDGTTNDPYTPPVQFGYDGVALTGCTTTPPGDTDSYPIGRATAMCDGSGATSWIHDTMGRVKQELRKIGPTSSNAKYVTYVFNLDGSLANLTTPPLKTVVYTYNGAARATKLVDSGDSINFATVATYAPPGELTGMTMGSATGFAGITTSNVYNNRLQPVQLYANSPSGTILSLCYDFHLDAAFTSAYCSLSASSLGNNGNVFQVINNRDTNRTQTFTYDSLNRITSGQSTGTGSISWGENYQIDAWGNLYTRTGVTGKANTEGLNCAANTNNQLTTCSFGYDAAGNMTSNNPAAYTYDAENRIIWTSGDRYIYDGNGERVEKCVAATPTTACPTSGTNGTLYWRGTGSDPLDESDLSGNALEEYVYFNGERIARRDVSTNAVHYYFDDHLGSTSLVTNATGTLSTCGTYSVPTGEDESDYYPYGGEIVLCNSVPQNYKFTGKERDPESGLDYFEARHYASALGRFMIPDWAAKPTDVPYANFGNPQSLNLYSYVQNNPTTMGDPDGHEVKVDPALSAAVTLLAAQSPTFANELKAHDGPNNPDLVIKSGATPTDADGVTPTNGNTSARIAPEAGGFVDTDDYHGSVVTINQSIAGQTDQVMDAMGHEVAGHVHDARTNTEQYWNDYLYTQQHHGQTPNCKSNCHDQRPEEQRANNANAQVKNERADYQKQKKEQEKEMKKKKKAAKRQQKLPS
jgi:RHS repeat-associated protein